jgi:glycosyltransferase involved in cell wall biosynthesis
MWEQGFRLARFGMPDSGAARLRRWLAETQPDVVHINCLPHLRGAKAARESGLPVVWHLREILPPGWRRRWFAGRLHRDATRIIAVSEAVAGWLREEGLGDLVEVVHNGVDPPAAEIDRSTARERFGLPGDAVVCGLFSQLVEHKGALDFVNAAHRAAAENPSLHFMIAGHGPQAFAERLRKSVASGAIADRIHLVPPRGEIWPLLAAVDAVAITTLWPDPLPRIVMEAMAVGLPVIGYTGGGVGEMVVDGETGMLCAPGDIDGLAAAMVRIAEDEGLRRQLGEAGRDRSRRLFSVKRHVDLMEAALQSASISAR